MLFVAIPAGVHAGSGAISIPEHWDGDALTVSEHQCLSYPWDGQEYSFCSDSTVPQRYFLRTMALRWQDPNQVLLVRSDYDYAFAGFGNLSLYDGYALSTGEHVLQPAFGEVFRGQDWVGPGIPLVWSNGSYNDSVSTFTNRPYVRIQAITGNGSLYPGLVRDTLVDERPRFDLVAWYNLTFTGWDVISGVTALKGTLNETTLTAAGWKSAATETVWLENGVPEPVRLEISESAGDLQYSLVQTVSNFHAGSGPAAVFGHGAPPRLSPPAALETGRVTSDGPADGSNDLALPLSQAVQDAKGPRAPADFLAWEVQHPAATLVAGLYQQVPGPGSGSVAYAPVGSTWSWNLTWADSSGSYAVVEVTRTFWGALPPIDSVTDAQLVVFVPPPAAAPTVRGITIGQLERDASAYIDHQNLTLGFELYADGNQTQILDYAYSTQGNLSNDPIFGLPNGASTIEAAYVNGTGGDGWALQQVDQTWQRGDELQGLASIPLSAPLGRGNPLQPIDPTLETVAPRLPLDLLP
ncbi:MAG: hypothetical protein ACYDDF_02185 [Thermoplasmatota archaeon]